MPDEKRPQKEASTHPEQLIVVLLLRGGIFCERH
jgi:hypothetical protein